MSKLILLAVVTLCCVQTGTSHNNSKSYSYIEHVVLGLKCSGIATQGMQFDHKCFYTVVQRISEAVLEALLPVIKEMKSDLNHLNELFSNLSDSVSDLNGTVEELKSKMCHELAELNETVGEAKSEMYHKLVEVKKTIEEGNQNITQKLDGLWHFLQIVITDPSSDVLGKAVLRTLLPYVNNLEETLVESVEEAENSLADDMECIKEDLLNINGSVAKIWDATPVPPKEYTCGGTGGWRRVVYLNMTDDNTNCPTGWNLINYSKRTCGRATLGQLKCDSVFFTVCGGCYTKVCGRITAYQYNYPDGFETYQHGLATTIDDAYVSGVSLTHGSPRQHIWTFACGVSQVHPTRQDVCPCDSDTNISVPPFVGGDYFCESGHNETSWDRVFHADDPLWDGKGCASSSTCCSFNNPPYFIKMLPSPTTDDIEARICQSNDFLSVLEDNPIGTIREVAQCAVK